MHLSQPTDTTPTWAAPSFRAWQKQVFNMGLLPVISIVGDRGKSTVVRLLDSIFQKAGLRTATWTDLGVEIRNRRQRGEISGWSQALGRLAESSIDIAIQELHWSMINTVGLPPSSYPLIGMTNLFDSHDGPIQGSQEDAWRGAVRAVAAVHQQGTLVVSGDDYHLIDASSGSSCDVVVTSLAADAPGLRRHLSDGGSGIWVEQGIVVQGSGDRTIPMVQVSTIPFCQSGAATFLTSSAQVAIAVATTVGIDSGTISRSLQEFSITDDTLPGSFNTYDVRGYRVVVDRATLPSHMRQLMRAVNPGGQRRQISMIGDLEAYPEKDVHDIGRLLGRHPGAVILHSTTSTDRIEHFRKGIVANDYPPLFAYLPTERRAINRALKSARPEDVVLVLTGGDSSAVIRAIHRQIDG